MKKKLSAFLCGVMCVTAFTGCSDTELAYLNMSREFLDTVEVCHADGKMKADVDFDALQAFTTDVSEALYGEGYADAENGLSGKKSIAVNYDIDMNMETMEYDMAFDVLYNGKTYDLGNLLYSLDKGVFVTNDTLWGAYEFYTDFMGDTDQYVMSQSFAKDFQKILAEDTYIELVSAEQLTGGVDMDAVLPENNTNEMYDAAFTFYENMLDGFETGMVQRTGNGYQIKANGHEVAQLLVKLLDFVAANPDQVLNATEAYLAVVMENAAVGTPEEAEMTKAEMAAMFAQMRASQEDFVAAAGDMSLLLQSMLAHPAVDLVLDAFSYEATVKQAGLGFSSVEVYDLTYEGKNIFRLVTDAKSKASAGKVTFPQSSMPVDELNEKLAKLENKYNPVTGVSVTWGMYGDNSHADLHTLRSAAEGTYFSKNYRWSELIVEDGRAYLPLRMVGEALSEDVGWDPAAKTAFVMQDDRVVKMEGKLLNDTTFVAVREFEKLGYTVTYSYHKDDFNDIFSYKEVTIQK